MANYLKPGVYVNEVQIAGKPISPAETSRVAFIGHAEAGSLTKPQLINSFADYQRVFLSTEQGRLTMPQAMTHSVMAFFGNGGTSAYICLLTDNDYHRFYQNVLSNYHDFSLIVLPGRHWGDAEGKAAIQATLAFCQQVRRCMLLLDVPPGQQFHTTAAITGLKLPSSGFAAVYYPWLMMANPLYQATAKPGTARSFLVAPSAAAAAIYGKTDSIHGVWKAPAGVAARLTGVIGTEFAVDSHSQRQLNPLGINCIRTLARLGTVLWGARTLASQSDAQWRYIPVKRMAIFLEQSIVQSLQWVVFEPNDQPLWQAVTFHISNFMLSLFRAGALQGMTQKEAFFVRCGLNQTMTQQHIQRHQLVIVLGFAPVKPAEFVVINITCQLNEP
ncbi:phage tail sheath family protein [Arsukibacterium sp.]|uniref:phage tail sheath family protein n=1 Tax=Arsukibacterium sp. TaxID=1977258 RepID=UPI00299D6FEB|nr:phage tail sheath C-terminal domain-containing protein [Arsukibacterium sp.]MDX1678369.1 phage tail sheath subtilisin-like domain-containing protein [Arsukibacterium sp.]